MDLEVGGEAPSLVYRKAHIQLHSHVLLGLLRSNNWLKNFVREFLTTFPGGVDWHLVSVAECQLVTLRIDELVGSVDRLLDLSFAEAANVEIRSLPVLEQLFYRWMRSD